MKPRIETPPLANGLPADSQWLFPEYDFGLMNTEQFAGVIIERVLERGSIAQTRWLLGCYGKRRIAAWVRRYGYRRLSHKVSEYWRWVFGIK
ncbi:MAG: hypothetical protein HYY33_05815, partial [Chloroflexi bacterium]|nr:hypothetical protein [Chloroflexota bacterium]